MAGDATHADLVEDRFISRCALGGVQWIRSKLNSHKVSADITRVGNTWHINVVIEKGLQRSNTYWIPNRITIDTPQLRGE